MKEGEAVELTFQKSPKGLESLQLPVMVGVCVGSEKHQRAELSHGGWRFS